MFKKIKKQILVVLILSIFIIPSFSSAALVQCGVSGENECTLCDLYVLVDNIIDFLMKTIAPALAIFVISYGGFYILIAGGDASKKQKGYNALKAAFIGILLVFGAWIIINEVLLFLSGNPKLNILSAPWTEIQCQ